MFLSNDYFKKLLDNLYDGVYFVDTKRRITYWNKGAERMTGYSAEMVMGKYCGDNLLSHCDENGNELCKTSCPLTYTMKASQPYESEIYLRHADGHRVPVLVRASPIHNDEGKLVGAVEIFSNNLKSIQARRRILTLEKTAFADPLTKLGNRLYFEQQYQYACLQMEFEKVHHGLLFMDIDNFKSFNDTYGHNIGDQVLKMVAGNLTSNLRETDVIARWGGEEFIVLLREVHPDEVPAIADKLRRLIESSRLVLPDRKALEITVSVGATLTIDKEPLESAVQRVDALMYQSKHDGRNRVTFSV